MLIYKVTNLINGKKYIGQTINTLKNRKYKHMTSAKKGSLIYYFHKALIKYGKKNFKWEVLCECENKDLLDIRETMKIIVEHSHVSEGNGYNLTWGGEGSYGYKHTNESKKKMSESRKGIKLSEGTRKKISKSKMGKKCSEETKERMSKSRKGIVKHTDETKRKIGNIVKNRIVTSETKKKMSISQQGHLVSTDIKSKISNTLIGHSVSEETRLKISNTLKKYNKEKAVGDGGII